MMVDPTLSEMGRNLDLAMRILGDGQSEPEVGTGRHKRTSIPGPLQGNGQDVASILQLVHNLVHDEDDEDEDTPVHVPHHVGEQGHMALLGHSLAAYMCVMDRERLRKLTTRVMSDTTLWLCRLFRYENGSAYVHEDDREGLVKVCRLVINARYEDYATDGYTALRTSQPVIYQSATCRPGLGQHLCSQLGLPLSSLCTVPCNTMFGSHHQMDVALLDKLIKEDVEAGKCPLLLLANAGTPAAGHTDKLARLKELCEQYNMWLHVEGVNLATLVLTKMSSTVNAATSSNSMTLTLGPWLGLPAVPAVTLYRHEDPALSLAAGLTSSQPMEKLRVLPLWLSLQYMGHTAIIHKISHATSLSQQLLEELRPVASIRTLVEDELTSPVVVFRFSQDTSAESSRGSTEGYCTGDREVLDTLNTWLGEQLIGQVPSSGVDVVQLEDEGTCIRFRPLMTAAVLGTESMDVGTLVQTVRELVPVLSSTLRLKQDFREEVHRHGPSLRYVQDLSWPGLGAVRYEPQTDCMDESKSQQQVEHINGELLKKLQELDADLTFSSGPPCGTEQNCIFVGMATEDLDVCDLVETMMSLGTDIEESGRLLENMTDVVRKGILEAELQLQKANQDKLMEEGMLRQLPLVGSVLNWFSPVDSSIMGRTFNLSAGCLDSTESTYNTKAQMGRLAPLSTPTSTNKRLPGQRLFRRYSGAPLDSTSETSSVEHTEELTSEPPTPSLSVPEEEISQRGPEEAPGPQGLEEAPEPRRPEPQGLEEAPEPGAPEPQGLEEAPEPQVMEEAPEPGAPEPHVMEAPPGETAPEDGSSSNRQLES